MVNEVIIKNNNSTFQTLDSHHFFHPFTDPKSILKEGSRVMYRGDDIYLWDSKGEKILDGLAGLWCVNVGYGREWLAKIAYEQLSLLPYYNSFFKFLSEHFKLL